MNSILDLIEENIFNKWWKLDIDKANTYESKKLLYYRPIIYVYPWRWSRSIIGPVCHISFPETEFIYFDEFKMDIRDWLTHPLEKPEEATLVFLQKQMAVHLLEEENERL